MTGPATTREDAGTIEQRHAKQLTYMRGMLDGMQYYSALEALEMARRLEDGLTRKDGYTPRLHHQLQVGRLVATLLPHLIYPEECITAAFLHDVLEDHPDLVGRQSLEDQFGHLVLRAVWRLSKKHGGEVKTQESYYQAMVEDPIASVVKPCDRAHNLHTMQGVFTTEKQLAYVTELDEWFFPLVKNARHRWPRQYAAYENLKIILMCQYELLQHLLRSSQTGGLHPEAGE